MFHIDYQKHNQEVRELLARYDKGTNHRIIMSISCNPRLILLNPQLNPKGITFEQYFTSPDIMLEIQARHMEYLSCEIVYDHIMGMDEAELVPYPDFQNILEPCWFGATVFYSAKNDPCARSFLDDDNKYKVLQQGMLDPFGGIMHTAVRFSQYFKEQQRAGYAYKGKPIVNVGMLGLGTDGPFTAACSMRGATGMCLDLYEEPDYAKELLSYITENIINRIRTLRKFYGLPEKSPSLFMADDSIAMLSTEDYIRYILPFHKQLFQELTTGEKPNAVHFCGDATRHFTTIVKELNVNYFDTGFPVRHGELVKELGPKITVAGGVHVNLLKSGPKKEIIAETRRILEEVKPYSRRFIIKEANNLSPETPPAHLSAMYNAVKEYGCFE